MVLQLSAVLSKLPAKVFFTRVETVWFSTFWGVHGMNFMQPSMCKEQRGFGDGEQTH